MMSWNDFKYIDRKEAKTLIKDKNISFAIRCEDNKVEIYKMETDPILKNELPAYEWIVRCRDRNSARRFKDELWKLRKKSFGFSW